MARNRYRKRLEPGAGKSFDSTEHPRSLTIAPAGEERVLFEIDEDPQNPEAATGMVEFPAAQVPQVMAAMVACTGKYPTELIRIAHEKGLLGKVAHETRQSRRARERGSTAPEKLTSTTNRKPKEDAPEIPDVGFFEFTDAYGDTLKVAPINGNGRWEINLTITSNKQVASAAFYALDVIPLFVTAGEYTGMDSRTLGNEAVSAGYMQNRQAPLGRAARRKIAKKKPQPLQVLSPHSTTPGAAFTKPQPAAGKPQRLPLTPNASKQLPLPAANKPVG